jgi:hypothetical protein
MTYKIILLKNDYIGLKDNLEATFRQQELLINR